MDKISTKDVKITMIDSFLSRPTDYGWTVIGVALIAEFSLKTNHPRAPMEAIRIHPFLVISAAGSVPRPV